MISYDDHMGIVFASTGKNNGTAIALATAAFSPLVAVPAATLPIFQIIWVYSNPVVGAPLRSPWAGARPAPTTHFERTQIIFLVGYLKLEKRVRRYFGGPKPTPA